MDTKSKIILAFLLTVVTVYVVVWFRGVGKETTDNAIIDAHTIPISARVSGYVTSLNINDNQFVKKGDVLIEIDSKDYELRVESAKAAVKSAEITAKNADLNAERYLVIGQAGTRQVDIDNALTTQGTAHANLDSAKSMLAIAEKDLLDTKIIAPEDGTITVRKVEKGTYVSPGEQMLILVGTERWIEANFKEVQITNMKPGQKVDIAIDAYPDVLLHGHIDSIQSGTGARFSVFPTENATGNFIKVVQRVPVKIKIDDTIPKDITLGAGLSVIVTVHLSQW
ncbi:MAG: HlyD family secretion protein [Candidatus Jidaibacter sp.]|jgi:membrane fusion protein (multidrug efflux system)|nr:HlyD family secretion protein [Candidatus Jidaibacter sp.]